MSKSWHDYIELSSELSPEERAATLRVLNDIWNFKDGEGQGLMRQAFETAGRKIIIKPQSPEHDPEGETYYDDQEGIIYYDFKKPELIIPTKRGMMRDTFTGTMVHELYHAADSTADVLAKSEETLLKIAGLTRADPRAAQLLARAKSGAPENDDFAKANGIVAVIMDASWRHRGYVDLSQAEQDLLYHLPFEERVEILKEAGIISPYLDLEEWKEKGHGSPVVLRTEEDAVQYTNAMMQKNYGPAVPVRDYYTYYQGPYAPLEGHSVMEDHSIPKLTGKIFSSPGFQAEEYKVEGFGDFPSPPRVKAVRVQGDDPSPVP